MADNFKSLRPYSGEDPAEGIVDAKDLSNIPTNIGMMDTVVSTTTPSLLSLDTSNPFSKADNTKPTLVDFAPSYSKRNEIAFNTKSQTLERYTSHPAYSRLGFSTLRDNESFYNANTKWTGDFVRASKYFFPVMGEVFLDNLGGGIRMFGNSGSLDPANIAYDKGDLMTHSAKMAMSTRGGLGQSVVNIGYNMNYTLGIISAIAAEDLLLTLAAPETFGGSLTAAGVRTVQGLGKAVKGTWETLKSVDKLKDALSAKRLYEQAAGATSALGRAFTPSSANFLKDSFRNSKAATRGYSRSLDAVTELFGTAKGFGAVYRDLRIAGLANDESMVEAAGVRQATSERLIKNYIAANGIMPSSEEIVSMEKQAIEAGNVDYWANLPFIYLTNNITFNSLAMPYGKGSRLMKVRAGKAGSVYGKLAGEKGTGVTAETLTRRQAFAKLFSDKDMRKYALSSLGSYYAANISEGVQEIYQESASKAIEDYFADTYLRPELAGMKLAKKNIKEGLAAQVSQQGLEAFLGGFLGGGIISGGGNVIAAGTDAINAGYRKVNKSAQEAYEERLEKDKSINKALVDIINSNGTNVIEALAPELVTLKQQADAQKGMSMSLELDDRVLFESIKDESLLNYISALADKGIVDNFLDALQNHKQLSDEELLQAIPAETREQAEKTIDDITARTKSIVATQGYVDKNFNNYYLDALQDPTITGDERKQMQVAANAFEHAKRTLVYMYYSQNRSLDRLNDITEAAVQDPAVAGMKANDISILFNLDGGMAGATVTLATEKSNLKKEVTTLKQQVENLKQTEGTTEEEKQSIKESLQTAEKELSEKTKLQDLLEEYSTAITEFNKNFEEGSSRGELNKVEGYDKYVKALEAVLQYHASKNNTSIDGTKVGKLAKNIIDFNRVQGMNKVFNQAVTNLSNPDNFYSFYENLKTALENLFTINLLDQLGKVSTTAVEKRKDVLEELSAMNVVIPNESIADPNIPESDSSLAKFIEDGTLPSFYLGDPESNDTDLKGRVIEGTETWNSIQDVLMRNDMLEEEAKTDRDAKAQPEEEVKEETGPEASQEEVEEGVEEVEEQENYEEQSIREELKDQPEVLGDLLDSLNEAYREYRVQNPRERIATLSEFMNGAGRAVTETELEKARAAAEGFRSQEEPVVETIEETIEEGFPNLSEEETKAAEKEFKSLRSRVNRSKKIITLEARRLDVDSSSIITDEQKQVLRDMINKKIAQMQSEEGPQSPTVSNELNNDISDSSLGRTEEGLRNEIDSPDETDPFDSVDNVCQ